MNPNTNWAEIGILVTVLLFLAGVIFNAGKMSARLDALEKWRETNWLDIKSISENLIQMSNKLKELATLIDERTDRRHEPRGVEKI